MKSTQLKGKLIVVGLCAIMVFGGAVTATSIANIQNAQLLAAVPGVSCSGVSFGTTDTADTADITPAQFLARFPAPTIVTSVSSIAKVYGDGTPSTENLKYGSSSGMGKFTLNLNRNITGVKMGLKAWSGDTNKVVIVNGIEFTVPSSDVYTDHEFTFAETNTITFTAKLASKNRGYISYISFYY
jgi:hypothetical protein